MDPGAGIWSRAPSSTTRSSTARSGSYRSEHNVSLARVDETGRIDLDDLEGLVDHATALVSIMFANNETGVIQPIPEVVRIARAKGALVHTDAVQGVGKVPDRREESRRRPADRLRAQDPRTQGRWRSLRPERHPNDRAHPRRLAGEEPARGNGERGRHRRFRQGGGTGAEPAGRGRRPAWPAFGIASKRP